MQDIIELKNEVQSIFSDLELPNNYNELKENLNDFKEKNSGLVEDIQKISDKLDIDITNNTVNEAEFFGSLYDTAQKHGTDIHEIANVFGTIRNLDEARIFALDNLTCNQKDIALSDKVVLTIWKNDPMTTFDKIIDMYKNDVNDLEKYQVVADEIKGKALQEDSIKHMVDKYNELGINDKVTICDYANTVLSLTRLSVSDMKNVYSNISLARNWYHLVSENDKNTFFNDNAQYFKNMDSMVYLAKINLMYGSDIAQNLNTEDILNGLVMNDSELDKIDDFVLSDLNEFSNMTNLDLLDVCKIYMISKFDRTDLKVLLQNAKEVTKPEDIPSPDKEKEDK